MRALGCSLVVFGCVIGLAPAIARADARACIAAHEAGIAARTAKRPLDARTSFVACTAAECPQAVREECATLLEQLERQIPSVVITARDPEGHDLVDVELYIDGRRAGDTLTGQAIELNPGQHEFRVVHPEHGSKTERALIVEGEKSRRITLAFASRRATEPAAPEPRGAPGTSLPLASYVLGGVGLVALGSFGFFAYTGKSKERELDDCAPACDPDEVDVMQRRYLIADISLGVGVVALGSAIGIALASGPSEPSAARVEVTLTPRSLSLGGSF